MSLAFTVDDSDDVPVKRGSRPGRPGSDESVVLPQSRSVTVLPPWQVAHDGNTFGPGETATVPSALAEEWLRNQWVYSKTGK